MTPVLMAVCLLVGVLIGLRVNARRCAALRELLRLSTERHDAWNLQAKATDLAEVGPVTGDTRAVELFDQDALDELREQATGLGPACSWFDGPATCDETATGKGRLGNGDVVDLCETHLAWVNRPRDIYSFLDRWSDAVASPVDDAPDCNPVVVWAGANGWTVSCTCGHQDDCYDTGQAAHEAMSRHLARCGWSDGDTVCGDPAAGTVTWPEGPVDLCATHLVWVRENEDAPVVSD